MAGPRKWFSGVDGEPDWRWVKEFKKPDSDEPAEQSCGNCRFWKAGGCGTEGDGFCRWKPPHPAHGYPSPHSSNWCGEWQYR
jgi:hypothetical protein